VGDLLPSVRTSRAYTRDGGGRGFGNSFDKDSGRGEETWKLNIKGVSKRPWGRGGGRATITDAKRKGKGLQRGG